MAPLATIIIPTFDHGPLLTYAIRSAQRQTLRNIEIFVVGDGAPDMARNLVTSLQNQDSRITYFNNPKGERHGEEHRHQALEAALGYIVCYLADDDLWLPNHVEVLAKRLRECDFASTFGAYLPPLQPLEDANFLLCDLAEPYFVNYLLKNQNLVPLSCVGHRLDSYRNLPEGWTPAPKRTAPELYMWRKFLRADGIRAATIYEPTVLHFPSVLRTNIGIEDRYAELRKMWQTISTRPGAAAVQAELRDLLMKMLSQYTVRRGPKIISRLDAERKLARISTRAGKWRKSLFSNFFSK